MPSRLLTVYLFAVILVSGVWIGTPALFPLIWIAALAVGAATQTLTFRLPLPDGLPVRANKRDVLLALVASAPVFIYLITTWRQEFPYLGDQWLHNAGAMEAYEFWWPWGWIVAAGGIGFVGWRMPRNEDSPAALIALAVVVAAGLAMPHPLSFAGRYPGTLHFVSAPLRALMHATSPLNVERLLNALSIPIWLLLRPLIVRRHVDIFAMTIAAMLFWQKDNVYYFTSGYLEPWAIVLLLTAGEHLIRFGAEAVWRPLLLLGAAAMVKEQLILGLPIVALIYFPFRGGRRAQIEHLVVSAVAATPFVLFWRTHELFKSWAAATPVPSEALSAAHFALFRDRIELQFGLALPIVIAAVALLILFAMKQRAFAALLCIAAADLAVIYLARILQPWAGYPRLNLVPLAMGAVAIGYTAERLAKAQPRVSVPHVSVPAAQLTVWSRPRVAQTLLSALLMLATVLNCIPLSAAIRDAFRPSSARSFIEHSDAPLFFPIRKALEGSLLPAGSRIDVLTNGKRIFQFFWAGPLEDQYPDLAARYRLRSASFAGNPSRCRCSDPTISQLALFIRFTNLGEHVPERTATEAEAQQCAAELLRTCARTTKVVDEGVTVGLLGAK